MEKKKPKKEIFKHLSYFFEFLDLRHKDKPLNEFLEFLDLRNKKLKMLNKNNNGDKNEQC